MANVKVKSDLEIALKQFNYQVRQEKILIEAKKRMFYTKPSERRRKYKENLRKKYKRKLRQKERLYNE